MSRYAPQSQTREVIARKQECARQLLARGLTVRQIATQLNCSTHLVRRVRDREES